MARRPKVPQGGPEKRDVQITPEQMAQILRYNAALEHAQQLRQVAIDQALAGHGLVGRTVTRLDSDKNTITIVGG